MTSRQLNSKYIQEKRRKSWVCVPLYFSLSISSTESFAPVPSWLRERDIVRYWGGDYPSLCRRVTVLKSVWLSVYSAKRSWSGAMFVSHVNPFGSDADGSQRDLDGRVISLLKWDTSWGRRRNPRDVWGGRSSTGKRILYIQESLPFARICISTHIYSNRMMQYSWRGNIGRPFRTRYNEHRRSLKDSLRMCTPNTVNGYICIYVVVY